MIKLTKKQRDAVEFGHLKIEGAVLVSGYHWPNGAPMFSDDGTMLDENGNRSVFDDVDE